jgi:hypothetical protein
MVLFKPLKPLFEIKQKFRNQNLFGTVRTIVDCFLGQLEIEIIRNSSQMFFNYLNFALNLEKIVYPNLCVQRQDFLRNVQRRHLRKLSEPAKPKYFKTVRAERSRFHTLKLSTLSCPKCAFG